MSEHVDVETRLRAALHETAATVEPAPDAWARVVERAPSRPPRLRRWYLAPVVALAAAVVVAVALATRSGHSQRVHVTGKTHDAVVLVPGSAAAGSTVLPRASGADFAGLTCIEGRYVGGKLDCNTVAGIARSGVVSGGSDNAGVQVATAVNDSELVHQLLRAFERSGVAVVRGHRAEVWRERLSPGASPPFELAALHWTERPGIDVVVESAGRSVSVQSLLDVANELVTRPVDRGGLPLAIATVSAAEWVAAGPSVDGFPCLSVTGAPCAFVPSASNGMVAVVGDVTSGNARAVYGAVPLGTARVRIQLAGTVAITDARDGPPGRRYFGAPVPAGAPVRSVSALDGAGQTIATVAPLDTVNRSESPGNGAGEEVGQVTDADGIRWTLRAEWQGVELCLAAASGNGSSSSCGEPLAFPLGGMSADDRVVSGWASGEVASIRVTLDGHTVTVTPTRRKGFPVGFFGVPRSTSGAVAIEARDRNGRVLETIPDLSHSSFGTSSSGGSGSSGSSKSSVAATTSLPR